MHLVRKERNETDRTDEHQFYFFRFLKEIVLYYGGNMSKNARSAL